MKQEYGPTLGALLAPRWRAASRPARAALTAAGVLAVAALAGLALTLENARYRHAGGGVSFGFEYRGLYRTAPGPGELVRLQARWPDGRLKYAYAVSPLRLARYAIEPDTQVALYASGLVRRLARTVPHFELRGEGKTKVNNTLIGYEIAYYTRAEGERLFARDVLLLPPGEAHPREGVLVWMLNAAGAVAAVRSPLEVGETGVLLRPLKTFSF